jgi:alanine dehydrogenase
VEKGPIRPGTHLNAIGADAQGKQELSPELLLGAKIVVDDIEQASHSGEINVPLSQGKLQIGDIYGTLGEVITGGKRGRANDGEITVFDSTGLAIQDIACANLVYDKVKSGEAQAVGSHA